LSYGVWRERSGSYDTRYDRLNRNRLHFGVEIAFNPRVTLDLSYVRQNDSEAEIEHVNALGTALALSY
jgi:hypothetical protein